MKMVLKNCITFFLLLPLVNNTFARPKLPYLFSDNMVLQQNTNAPIWGWAGAGKTVMVSTSWNGKKYSTKADENGKWKLAMKTISAGGPYTVSISDGESIQLKNVWLGEVWICGGQSNMEMPLKGFRDQTVVGSMDAMLQSKGKNIHMITIPRASFATIQDTVKACAWSNANPQAVANFSATGWFFGDLLNKMLDVPVGLISCSYGGSSAEAWMDQEALKPFPDIAIPQANKPLPSANLTATGLYNGMLEPILGYGLRGAIWYQGESNTDRPGQYKSLFPALVKSWRNKWAQGDFPFYYVQIAPYTYSGRPGKPINSALLRESQLKALDSIPNSGMAVIMDVAERYCIHPANKKEGGQRLALIALSKTYGVQGLPFESPTYDSLMFNGSTVTIRFKNAKTGLTSYGKSLTTFQVAGKDKKFCYANASIIEGRVVLSSPKVPQPTAVRYAFRDFVVGELFSTEGLPVPSFRTDDWTEGVTEE